MKNYIIKLLYFFKLKNEYMMEGTDNSDSMDAIAVYKSEEFLPSIINLLSFLN